MGETDTRTLEILEEIRDLVQLLAAPQLLERERQMRERLIDLGGSSVKRQKALCLMDGQHRRPDIQREAEMDSGNLSRLISALREADLYTEVGGLPKLRLNVDESMFGTRQADERQ